MTAKIEVMDDSNRRQQGEQRTYEMDDERLKEKDFDTVLSTTNKMEKSKRGFRIDDILFSVERKTEKNFKMETLEYRTTPSPSSNTSDSSHHSLDEINNMSPVSFIKRPQPIPYKKTYHHHHTRPHLILSPSVTTPPPPTALSTPYQYSRRSSLTEETDCENLCNDVTNDSKKPRTSFTPDQIQTLEDAFNEKHYLNHTERTLLAEELNLTDCQIKTWFQNRRMKMKRQYKEAVEKGYLIPYHPYPFPRYSRLTPAHFASVPALNTRHVISKNGNNYPNQSNTTNNCTCCGPNARIYPQNNFTTKPMRTTASRSCGEYSRNRPRSPPDVLPRRRTFEQRRELNSQYNGDLRDYFHNLPLRSETKDRTKKYV